MDNLFKKVSRPVKWTRFDIKSLLLAGCRAKAIKEAGIDLVLVQRIVDIVIPGRGRCEDCVLRIKYRDTYFVLKSARCCICSSFTTRRCFASLRSFSRSLRTSWRWISFCRSASSSSSAFSAASFSCLNAICFFCSSKIDWRSAALYPLKCQGIYPCDEDE